MHVLKSFDYFEPQTVKEATLLLSTHEKKGQVLAGGVDLIPRMRTGREEADFLVNIQRIPDLDKVEKAEAHSLTFGAAVKLQTLETSKSIQDDYPILYDAIHQISSLQTKCMGTVVGNICVATPASDIVTTLFVLDAVLTIEGVNGEREESIKDFYVDYGRTTLQRGELVTKVFLPAPRTGGTSSVFMNLVRTHADIAKISIAVTITVRGNICRNTKIAVGAAAPTVIRAIKAETVLLGQKVTPNIINKAAATAAGETKPITDLRSTAQYRREVTEVLVRRALEKAIHQVRS